MEPIISIDGGLSRSGAVQPFRGPVLLPPFKKGPAEKGGASLVLLMERFLVDRFQAAVALRLLD
jgi:hypothetical protein